MASKPPTPGTGKALLVRVQPPLHERLSDWIKRHSTEGEHLTPPEALRRLAEIGLTVTKYLPSSAKALTPVSIVVEGKRFESIREAADAHGLRVNTAYVMASRNRETAAQVITAMLERRRAVELRRAKARVYIAAREKHEREREAAYDF